MRLKGCKLSSKPNLFLNIYKLYNSGNSSVLDRKRESDTDNKDGISGGQEERAKKVDSCPAAVCQMSLLCSLGDIFMANN